MEASEYLAFVPLLIYGIGLADLLSEWKRLFDPKEWYLPYSLFTIMLTEVAVYNIFIYRQLIEQLPGKSYAGYLLFLIPPFLFMLATVSFTPDKESSTKEYFIKRMPVFFFLLALFIGSHFLFTFHESPFVLINRIAIVVILLITGFTRKIWLIYIVALMWLVTFILKTTGGGIV